MQQTLIIKDSNNDKNLSVRREFDLKRFKTNVNIMQKKKTELTHSKRVY